MSTSEHASGKKEDAATVTISDSASIMSDSASSQQGLLQQSEHSQKGKGKEGGKLERFLQKHGMHQLGTEPQDVQQTKDRNKLIASMGGIYIPSKDDR